LFHSGSLISLLSFVLPFLFYNKFNLILFYLNFQTKKMKKMSLFCLFPQIFTLSLFFTLNYNDLISSLKINNIFTLNAITDVRKENFYFLKFFFSFYLPKKRIVSCLCVCVCFCCCPQCALEAQGKKYKG